MWKGWHLVSFSVMMDKVRHHVSMTSVVFFLLPQRKTSIVRSSLSSLNLLFGGISNKYYIFWCNITIITLIYGTLFDIIDKQVHIQELEEEVKLLKNLSHPNIVVSRIMFLYIKCHFFYWIFWFSLSVYLACQRYLGTVREEETLNILLEFVPGGSISSLLGKFGSFPESVSC